MAPPYLLAPITPGELTSRELRQEALINGDNPTREVRRLTPERETVSMEVVFFGDARTALVAWKGNVQRYWDVGSVDDAFERAWDEFNG